MRFYNISRVDTNKRKCVESYSGSACMTISYTAINHDQNHRQNSVEYENTPTASDSLWQNKWYVPTKQAALAGKALR